jgi:hypothetical protein
MSIDLKKIISNVVEEGFMETPKQVLQPIVDFYLDKLKEFRSIGRTKSSKKFGMKQFQLDFTGTRYEFLNNYTNKLTVQLSNGDKSWASDDASGYVQLDFSDPMRAVTEVIEHEILHIMQMANNKRVNKKDIHTGLPKKKFIKREEHPNPKSVPFDSSSLYKITKNKPTNYYGQSVGSQKKFNPNAIQSRGITMRGGKVVKPKTSKSDMEPYNWSNRRVEHHRRPIELYPDLLTTIRNLQASFQKVISLNPDITDKKSFYNNTENRKKYFGAFVKGEQNINIDNNDLRVFAAPVGDDLMKSFKKDLPDNLYKYFLKIFYDAFVNRQAPFDYEEVKEKLREIGTAQQNFVQKERERLESGDVSPKDFKFNTYELQEEDPYAYDFIPNTADSEEEDDPFREKFEGNTIEAAENILSAFGLKVMSYRDDSNRLQITTDFKKILKAFNEIGKDRTRDEQTLKEDPNDNEALPPKFWDKLKESLKERYVKALTNPNLKSKLADYIDLEYNSGKG